MKETPPFVQIVILNWNGHEVTIDCLKSLLKVDYPNFRILLVDNGSADSSIRDIEQFILDYPQISLLPLDKNYGFTGGNNKGVEHILASSTPDHFLLLNNDTEVEPTFLLKMVALLEKDNQTAAVVPKIFYYSRPDTLWYAGGYINKFSCMGEHYGINKQDSVKYSKVNKVTFMNGCAMLIRTSIINELGLFDDDLFANCEDVDLSIRLLQNGYNIMYEPNAVVLHKVSYSFTNSNNKWFGFYIATRNLVILQKKHNLSKWYFPFAFSYFFLRWFLYLEIKFLLQANFLLCKYLAIGLNDGFTKRLRKPL